MLRLIGLGNIPYGFANDEVSYIMSGYTIMGTGGFDIAGAYFPFSINLDSSLSPMPVYIIALFTFFLGLSPFTVRLPFALMGIGSVVLVYFIMKELFASKSMALLAMFSLAISPWSILLTRSVWDVIPAQFFYLLGIYILLKKIKKGRFWISTVFFLFAFYSYHATKVFFLFLSPLLIGVFWQEMLQRKRQFVFFLLGIIFIFSSFFYVLSTQHVTRQAEIVFSNESTLGEAAKNVNFERDKSSAPDFLRKIESNKGTFLFHKVVSNYLGAFSPQHLVLIGDTHPVAGYGVFFKGIIYLIDMIFLIAGFAFIVSEKKLLQLDPKKKEIYQYFKKSSLLLLGMLLISPIPSAVASGNSYLVRSFMMAPFLSMFIGLGLFASLRSVRNKSKIINIAVVSLIIIGYFLCISRFFYQYYFQFNYYGGEYWNRSSRELSDFILKKSPDYKQIIVASGNDKVILQYSFASKALTSELQKAWRKEWPIRFGKVTFLNNCDKRFDVNRIHDKELLYIIPGDCVFPHKPNTTIVDPLEPSIILWKIYE